ncbi:hypothetical protein K488DRAFT_73606 [Vararia minispora EC-137]|uniref:Uncharacterized protein n=1 Tax=Vararia minispora EC-137 TaxID=1314806 RepID=A0ACB8QAL8_9AGAM|nr:hypothetical protein K488DRAFT_73606 [Vararia minispora EC-137]
MPRRARAVHGSSKPAPRSGGVEPVHIARRQARHGHLSVYTQSSNTSSLKARSRRRFSHGDARTRPVLIITAPVQIASKRRRLRAASLPSSSASNLRVPPRYTPDPINARADPDIDELAFPIFSRSSLDAPIEPPAYADITVEQICDLDPDQAPAHPYALDGWTRSPLADCIRKLLSEDGDREQEIVVAEYNAVKTYKPVIENVAVAYAARIERWAPAPPISLSYLDGCAVSPRRATSPGSQQRLRFAAPPPADVTSPTSPRRAMFCKLSADALFGRPRLSARTRSSPSLDQAPEKSVLEAEETPLSRTTSEKRRSFLSRTLSTKEGQKTVFGIRVRG